MNAGYDLDKNQIKPTDIGAYLTSSLTSQFEVFDSATCTIHGIVIASLFLPRRLLVTTIKATSTSAIITTRTTAILLVGVLYAPDSLVV